MPLDQLLQMLPEGPLPLLPLLELLPEAFILADADGIIAYWNKGAENIFQYTSEEVIGQPLTVIIPEQYKASHIEAMKNRKSMQRGVSSAVIGKTNNLSGLKKDGSEFPIQISVVSYVENDKVCYLGVVKDVTDIIISTQEAIAKQLLDFAEGIKSRMTSVEKTVEKTLSEHDKIVSSEVLTCPFAKID